MFAISEQERNPDRSGSDKGSNFLLRVIGHATQKQFGGAGGRTRTGTEVTLRGIFSPAAAFAVLAGTIVLRVLGLFLARVAGTCYRQPRLFFRIFGSRGHIPIMAKGAITITFEVNR